MREILFRGFHPDENGKEKAFVNGEWINGFWVYGYYFEEIGSFIKERPGAVSTLTYLVLTHTVGQYTGLKDKNGKKIFEGDMVKCYDKNVDESFFAIIMFGNPNGFYNYGWQLKPIGKTDFNVDILCWVDMEDTGAYIEIIGNIYENPELLEDQA